MLNFNIQLKKYYHLIKDMGLFR